MISFIIPPGLIHKIREFEAHYKVAEKSPIMICGHSGVGKSLFLHIFKKLYQESYGSKDKIETVNCSHFTGDLARSELFGHVKGSFTGAAHDTDGWLKRADGGVLVLEEVGELPKETQAKLLTFIETGEFHKVGSSKIETANVQIVAATNNEKDLRDDFRFRFFPFYVSPICERRQDVLYYLAAKFPQLIASLSPWEVMILMAYNWSGNVREIEKVGRLLKRRKLMAEEDTSIELLEEAINLIDSEKIQKKSFMENMEVMKSGLGSISYRDTALKSNKSHQLYNELAKNGINVRLLESLLNQYKIGLSVINKNFFFKAFREYHPEGDFKYDKRFEIQLYSQVSAFKEAYRGFQAFCTLFQQDEKEDKNLMDITHTTFLPPSMPITYFFKSDHENIELFESIDTYIKREKLQKNEQSELYSMNKNELMKLYYQGVLERSGGNQTEAAKRAGIKYTTFRDQLKKYGIS